MFSQAAFIELFEFGRIAKKLKTILRQVSKNSRLQQQFIPYDRVKKQGA